MLDKCICVQEVENDEESDVSSDEEGEEGEDGGKNLTI